VFVVFPEISYAASSVLKPIISTTGSCVCTGSAPDWGCVLQTIQTFMGDFVAFATVIMTIFIAWAGFTYIQSPTNAEKRSQANARILNAIIGLVIVLCAWLLVDTVMKTLYKDNAGWGPWNTILVPATAGAYCIKSHTIDAGSIATQFGNTAANNNGGVAPPGAIPSSSTQSGSSKLDIQAAIAHLQTNAFPLNGYTGQCAQYVRLALAAGGLSQFSSGVGNANAYGPPLTSAGFTAVYTGTYSSNSDSAFAYQAGDIAVFQAVANHPYGHITMYTGSQWISDAVQNGISSNRKDYVGGSFTIYRP
jgi:hypothetical protein